MGDPAGKHIHDNWVADIRASSSGVPMTGITGTEAPVSASLLFRMKAVKDYEFTNYVRNLRRATSLTRNLVPFG